MNTSNLPGELLIGLAAIAVIVWVAGLALPPHRRRRIQRACVRTVGGVVGAYLVGRAVAEFFLVKYDDPGSYSQSWGGPSLAGVFAVHSGPGLAVLIAATVFAWRHFKRRQRARPVHADPLARSDAV
jgi:hypothetical protein